MTDFYFTSCAHNFLIVHPTKSPWHPHLLRFAILLMSVSASFSQMRWRAGLWFSTAGTYFTRSAWITGGLLMGLFPSSAGMTLSPIRRSVPSVALSYTCTRRTEIKSTTRGNEALIGSLPLRKGLSRRKTRKQEALRPKAAQVGLWCCW